MPDTFDLRRCKAQWDLACFREREDLAFGREAMEGCRRRQPLGASIKPLSAVACVVAFLLAPACAGAFSGANGKIAFSTCCRDGNYEFY
jgi:hypothetical protein